MMLAAAPKKHLDAAILAVSLLILVWLVALVPVPTSGLQSRPDPLLSYAASMAAASRVQHADDSIAAPGGRSIVLTLGRATARALVLLHGFTNSPLQFDSLADLFYRDGVRVSDSLSLPHDVIDPRQRVRRTDVVYPVVMALARGESPARQLVAPIRLETP